MNAPSNDRAGAAGHTPGPWHVADGGVCAVNCPADGSNVICCEPERIMAASLAKWPDNAPLIAAAPDLYEALVRVVADCQLAIDVLGNSPAEFESVRLAFGIVQERAQVALSKARAGGDL